MFIYSCFAFYSLGETATGNIRHIQWW